MRFPHEKYEELPTNRRNTLQMFITNACNLHCDGCFARNVMGEEGHHMTLAEYETTLEKFLDKGGKQINLIGGEPLVHPNLKEIMQMNRDHEIKTTIYTNGDFLNRFNKEDFKDMKIRASIYGLKGEHKSLESFIDTDIPLDFCYMVSSQTTTEEMLETAKGIEQNYDCDTFFISSLRELDNPEKDFFKDTDLTMNLLDYKELVHDFLHQYKGDMEIHVSKRGVFESTKSLAGDKCKFSNYFIDGKIIQCPYDIVNQKYQGDYEFDERDCQHNNSCLMSKVVYKRKG